MPPAAPPFPIARFTVDQYHLLVRSGIFTEDDRVELIDGWLVEQCAKGPGHEFTTAELAARIEQLLPPGMHVRNQAPLTLDQSEPEPDLSVVRGSRAAYRNRHPGAQDVVLVIEVSETTLATDRIKGQTYARAGIPEYWIVNLVDRRVEVHRQPAQTGYAHHETLTEDQALRVSAASPGAESILVRDILP